jgi:hypothetical protein
MRQRSSSTDRGLAMGFSDSPILQDAVDQKARDRTVAQLRGVFERGMTNRKVFGTTKAIAAGFSIEDGTCVERWISEVLRSFVMSPQPTLSSNNRRLMVFEMSSQ